MLEKREKDPIKHILQWEENINTYIFKVSLINWQLFLSFLNSFFLLSSYTLISYKDLINCINNRRKIITQFITQSSYVHIEHIVSHCKISESSILIFPRRQKYSNISLNKLTNKTGKLRSIGWCTHKRERKGR